MTLPQRMGRGGPPPHEVSLRAAPIGGRLAIQAQDLPAGLFGRARRLVAFVHGFNVTLCEAGCAYGAFKRYLPGRLLGRVAAVYWPGDAAPRWRRDQNRPRGAATIAASALAYSFQIGTAENGARLLEQLISGHANRRFPVQMDFVAHSLGCRLTLELLDRLRRNPAADRPRIGVVALMAAAVPRWMVLPGGSLHDAARSATKLLVFQSEGDGVLRVPFQAGQQVEGEWRTRLRMRARAALGRYGVIGVPGADNIIDDRLGHSDYWPNAAIARRVVDELENTRSTRHLGRVAMRGRAVPVRSVAARDMELRRVLTPPRGRQLGMCQGCPPC